VGALWAKDKVEALVDRLRDGVAPDQVRSAVLAVALPHRLVTRYTSLVAVDMTPARPQDADLVSSDLPTNLPHGWTRDGLMGEPDAAPPVGPDKAAAPAPLKSAATKPRTVISQGPAKRLHLPQTATPAFMHLYLGIIALSLALLLALVAAGGRRAARRGLAR